MRVFLLSILALSNDAFLLSPVRLMLQPQLSTDTRRAALFSTEPDSIETSPAPSAPPSSISVVSDSDGDLKVDFDELSKESAANTFKTKLDLSELIVRKERRAPRQAQWFPMLLSPTPLDGSLAGDVGFDPLGFSNSPETLLQMREAEVKHGRLAMLAAAGWPLSELWHAQLARALGLDSILASENRAPSVLNGGLLNEWIIGTGVITVVLSGLLEYATIQAQQKAGYRPGDLGFDPLGLYSFRSSFGLDRITEKLSREEKLARAKFDMELCETKHGRLAMLAISGFAAQEFVTGISVVEQTPFFFGDPMF